MTFVFLESCLSFCMVFMQTFVCEFPLWKNILNDNHALVEKTPTLYVLANSDCNESKVSLHLFLHKSVCTTWTIGIMARGDNGERDEGERKRKIQQSSPRMSVLLFSISTSSVFHPGSMFVCWLDTTRLPKKIVLN